MHFLEALDLAQHIHRTRPGWEIIAIGRFVPIEQCTLGQPWGISVIDGNAGRPRIIWHRDDLDPEATLPATSGSPLPVAGRGDGGEGPTDLAHIAPPRTRTASPAPSGMLF